MAPVDAPSLASRLGNWTQGRGPLHRRLADALQAAIRHGLLPARTRLPGERPLAHPLALSRTTVVNAYNVLRADGWLESRTGSGTWVSRGRALAARHDDHAAAVAQNPMMNLLLIDDSTTVDFALGTPNPLAELPAELYTIGADVQETALANRNYMPLGFPALREAIAHYYTARRVQTAPDQVLVTSGAQQAIHLIVSMLVQRADTVSIESPTYFGALSALKLAGARLAALDIGDRHIDVDAFRMAVRAQRPRLLYLTPTYHNPTGTVMPAYVRKEIAYLARASGITIVEDGTLADLAIDDHLPVAPIASYAPDDAVLTIGSLSKLFWAGLRIGWVRGPAAVIQQLGRIKSASDLGSPLLTQAIATKLLSATDRARALRRAQLGRRRHLLVTLLGELLPEWRFTLSRGGFFLWVRIPGIDARHFAQSAARRGVAVTPGPLFSVDQSHTGYLRIPYLLDESLIQAGVERMAVAWRDCRHATGLRSALRARAIV